MSKKIRVIHYCNQLSIGGTERSMELFCKYLDKEKFDVHVVSRIHREKLLKRLKIELGALAGIMPAKAKKKLLEQMNARVPNFLQNLGADKVHFVKDDAELREKILALKPDILHVWYSGRAEPPTSDEEIMSKVPVTITTNSFEIENTSPAHRHVKRYFFPSKWVQDNVAPWAKGDSRAGYFYSPIEEPLTQNDMRGELGIPRDAFVVGRVGRADPGIHDPISLRAFQKIQDDKSYFLALSPPENMIAEAKKLGIKNFIALAPVDQEGLSRFYNTLDVLVHARRDGETFGCNIAEAMMHGKPVVSHISAFMNAHTEIMGDTGYVVAQDDWESYAKHLQKLREDKAHRRELSERAKARAMSEFEVKVLTKRLEQLYFEHFRNIQVTNTKVV